jgi:hypothetical protein
MGKREAAAMSMVYDFECREFRPSRMRPTSPKPEEAFERPACTTCNQDMWLIRAEPHAVLAAYDVWSFECPGCKATKQLTVDRWSKTPPP